MVDFPALFSFIGGSFFEWLRLFIAPLENLDMLWIIVPIWGVWIFSEFFQEKKGTSFGNAITNGAVMLFVGVDWIRYIIRNMAAKGTGFGIDVATEVAISGVIILVSLGIIIMGIKGRSVVKLIGRARESTYILLMFTPIIYGVVDFNFRTLGVILIFFPVFYILVEILDRVLPNPQTFELEEGEKLDRSIGMGGDEGLGLQGDFGQGMFGQLPGNANKPFQQKGKQGRKGF